ncbi:MAG: hypothetical protein M3T96_10575 [Acidobacteriota bacterium]|nr:hypothetical protein [Acidobacteriota bacterium]
MKKICPNCRLVNFPNAADCVRCHLRLPESVETISPPAKSAILRRAIICVVVCVTAVLGFYLSMIFTSSPLKPDEKQQIQIAVNLLEAKGYTREVFLLRHLTNYRSNDNWLNASTRFENAYAATNFPFEIMTIYPDFFTFTTDDIERAAILLHEAQHLKGADEKEAYEFVWLNRQTLGWTKDRYAKSVIWRNIRKQTAEYAPNLFVCDWNEARDCTENGQNAS